MENKKRYLIEIRNRFGFTVYSSVETNENFALTTLLENLSVVGLPTGPTDEYGSPHDAIYSIGPIGSEPEIWETPNGTRIVVQLIH